MSLGGLVQIQLEDNCQHALQTCDFNGVTGPNCASQFCTGFPATSGAGTCPSIGLDPKNCCSSSNPASCLYAFVHSSGSGSSGSSASANPCASVVSVMLGCSSAHPSLFPSGTIYKSGPTATQLASCMCYNAQGAYEGTVLDAYASTCVAEGSSAHPTYFPVVSFLSDFCTHNAAAAGAPATAVASTTVAGSGSGSSGGAGSGGSVSSSPATAAAGATTTAPAANGGSNASPSTTAPGTGSAASPAAASTTSTKSSSASPAVKNIFHTTAFLILGISILAQLY